jgi:lysophospholipase L1-like esterase
MRHHTLVCVRALFYTYNESHNSSNKRTGILTTDGVHLNDEGNLFVAQEMLKVLPQASYRP